jgi:hypothetical protein
VVIQLLKLVVNLVKSWYDERRGVEEDERRERRKEGGGGRVMDIEEV